MRPKTTRRGALLSVLLLFATILSSGWLAVPSVSAATFTVTTLGDTGAGSLRQAVADAAAASGADTIIFQTGLTGTINLASTITINHDVTIIGPGTGVITVRDPTTCCFNGPLFTVTGGTVAISDLRITGDSTSDGAILATGGSLTLARLLVNNLTQDGIVIRDGAALALSDSTLNLNASEDLKVEDSTATLTNVTLSNGGRGLYALRSTVTLNNSTITGNESTNGNGIESDTSTINLNGTAVSNNGTDFGWNGGGIWGTASTITLTNSTVNGNKSNNGGGIYVQTNSALTLNGSTVSGNTSSSSAGIRTGTGTANITNSTISGNTASGDNGGMGFVDSTITIAGSTISGNKSGSAYGAGQFLNTTATITNSTISGNTANFNTGGILVDGNLADVTLRSVTLTGNIADFDNDGSGNGGGFWRRAGSLKIQSSIIAGNLDTGGQENDCWGSFTSLGNNIFGNATDCPQLGSTDAAVADINSVLNATLANNGGPTFTHALVAGSPAVGAGATSCAGGCPAVDQRGVARPQGANPDIGAYEAEGSLANPVVTHALNLSTVGSGTVSVLPAPNAAGGRYTNGTQVTIAATAGGGQTFTGWTVNNAAAGTTTPLVLTMDGDKTVVANFGSAAQTLLTVQISGSGSVSRTPAGSGGGPFGYATNTVVTLTPQPAVGQTFVGWTVDNVTQGWANPLTITMNTSHTVRATFAPTSSFPDVGGGRADFVAIRELASRGTIKGYQNGRYGPDDRVRRDQMAALIARAMPAGPGTPPQTLAPPNCLVAGTWDCENWGNTFSDRGGVDANLWRNAGTMQHYGVSIGYSGATCAAKRVPSPCYGPGDNVTYAQTVSFITRAMKAKGYWQDQPGAPLPYSNVPSAHQLDVRTFHFYTGGVPAAPSTVAGWEAGATRGWFARALWAALDSYWRVDRVP